MRWMVRGTDFSLSTRDGQREGRILVAQSSSVNISDVAPKASSAALRACMKGSRSERPKAAMRTLDRVYFHQISDGMFCEFRKSLHTDALIFLAILPRQMVVFVRMPGSGSLAVLARYFSSSPLIVLSDNLPTIVRVDLTVCSRSKGA